MPDDDQRFPTTYRNFSQLISGLEDGQLHADLTEAYENAVADMNSEMLSGRNAKATITLKIDFTGKDGFIETLAAYALKQPVKARRRSIAFVDANGKTMSREDPRQAKLPLREIQDKPTAIRQIAE